ncbi:nucleoside triphosphate pyrophosphohydrolase [Hippea maritima]|uniref:MazG family protein n=1 Tax=Hippea maritima (strain ATCC 700847 / DSM 10411 / MH2) TaxID=760142 RepID=F2LUD4_HIPMA|nr:nucleoside triphosphate pyrophosphohydrolase [Hippea maritima]AEA33460.1 MazG family protein [Hippea maritima DSM 10411]
MSEAFDRLVNTIKRLRAPDGCPWDRKQTLYSLKQNVIEEVFEFIDALDRKDIENIKEELGDMLLHVIFHSIIAQEDGLFNLDDVINGVNEKLIRRHPHVFGDLKVEDVDEVLKNWEQIKLSEKNKKPTHLLDGLPRGLPPIERAYKIQKKVSKVGFDFESPDDAFDKVEEEFLELKRAFEIGKKEELENEVGDLIFAVLNFARMCGINASEALRKTSLRFEDRFNCIEDKLKSLGLSFEDVNLEQMDNLWDECKGQLKG